MILRRYSLAICPATVKRKLGLMVPPTLLRHRAESLEQHNTTTTNAVGPANKPIPPLPVLSLNAREQQLRQLLLHVCKSIDATGKWEEPLVLRWAGGWVRDKLLGVESHDIDVAINTMTGLEFAESMCEICSSEVLTGLGLATDDLRKPHKIARNPEKSKHLETATVRILGLDVDFVDLRRETYAADSRNPVVERGTARQDAFRRDATINALFYNIHDNCIEDFTCGLSDLENCIIRTPLEPLQTFTDDPLRVLRLIRFASRLKFAIDPETEKLMDHAGVLDALRVKISRERVGIELEKMLKGEYPCAALQLIDRLNLYHAIFTDPHQTALMRPEMTRWHVAYNCLSSLMAERSHPGSVGNLLVRADHDIYAAWNLAALSPWMTIQDVLDGLEKGKPPLPLVAVVARNGFRAPNKLFDLVAASQRHMKEIIELKTAVCSQQDWVRERDKLGMIVRRWDSRGGSWTLQVLNALLVDAMEQLETWSDRDCQHFLAYWQQFLDHLGKIQVYNAHTIKPLVDGHMLARSMQVKPGKWMVKALDVCMAWQLRNPDVKDASGAIDEVHRRRHELGIPE
ncbi:hypothetical protein CDD81_4809 [Ophiocordyceps australis]|uniref:Poly A polymerase head domain-containing protein n=1 Tax=Ophiocordyceps australis TaxID=1399860 RepID=A0A2C5XVH5_9HYPO|nr:hypothetical protein CDD81_4809 [Ophiocordyceps australis]